MAAYDSRHGALDRLRALLALPQVQIEWVEEIDSTNSELRRQAHALPARALLVADAQSAGRGRRGRVWEMPAGGNLAMSLFARLPMPASALGGLSVVIGVASAEALRELGVPDVGLKWPNDLWARGRKLGGLLIELGASSPTSVEAVIGIGLNLRLPADAPAEWISLEELGFTPEREVVAAALTAAMLDALGVFETAGLATFLTRWEALDQLHGAEVRVIAADAEHCGRALGVRADGALRVCCEDGERAFLSGDVSLRAA